MKLDEVQRAAQEQFAKQSGHYGRGHVLENTEDVRVALDFIPLPTPAQVLDLATGAGHTGLFLAGLGHQVILADIAGPMLSAPPAPPPIAACSVQTRQHAAEHLPYPDSQFDLVTCRVAAHHFSSPESSVRESARVLKPGGYFLLIDGTVADGEPEAEAWAHTVEKLRDPSHHRLLTPNTWSGLCAAAGLEVRKLLIAPFKQPDLDWYFEAAATSPENRAKVLQLVANAPASARRLFRLGNEDGKIVWWWQRLTLVARKPGGV